MQALPRGLTMRVATRDDVAAISILREQLGWNVFEWALRDAMRPPHARFLLVMDPNGAIVGMGSGIAYGPIGVVGNMVVRPDHQRQGIGSTLLNAVIEFLADERGCILLELNATPAGRPLYLRHGFVPAKREIRARFDRKAARVAHAGRNGIVVDRASTEDVDRLADWDRARFGGDRRPILEAALRDPDRPVLLARRDDELVGYLVARPAVGRIGPWLADDPAAAGTLLASAAPLHEATVGELSAALPGENDSGAAWFRGIGADVSEHDTRMRRGDEVPRRFDTIFGTIVGALG